MRVQNIRKEANPEGKGQVRVAADVLFEKSGERRTYWFEVAKTHENFLDESGNAWLCFAAPYAMLVGEDLQIDKPVDGWLKINVSAALAHWAQVFPHFRLPMIEVETHQDEKKKKSLTAAFFSGGVDSLFTLLRNGGDGAPKIELGGFHSVSKLVFVWGFDIRLEEKERFETTQTYLANAAEQLGKELVVVKTNIRSYMDIYEEYWEYILCGSALGSVGHVLGNGLERVLIGSTLAYGQLEEDEAPHPLTDPLFSSSTLQIMHDGAQFNRVEKIFQVVKNPIAMKLVRVCNYNRDPKKLNCSRCQNCLRTMMTMDMAGCTGKDAPSFDWNGYSPALFEKTYLQNWDKFAKEVRVHALRAGRVDIARAVEKSLRRSRWFVPMSMVEKFLRQRLPFLKRYRKQLLGLKNMVYRGFNLNR